MDVRRPRLATAAMFLVSGAAVGTWAANIPYARDRLDLSTSTIGLCLLAMAAGSALAMPVAGWHLQRRRSAWMTRMGAVIAPLAGAVPLLAPSVGTLALALFVLGAAAGTLDVSMNAHAVAVEQAGGRPIMSSLHGGWSLGGLAGAGWVALSHVVGADPRPSTAVAMALLLVLGLAAGPHLGAMSASEHSGRGDEAAARERRRVPLSRGALVIGAMTFMLFMAEGSMIDWSALYLDDDLGTSATLGAIGYGAFSGGMATGRLLGDRVNRRVGAHRLLVGGTLVATAAVAGMLVVGTAWVALPALLLVGLGLANGVPLLFSEAGRLRDMPPGPAIAAASTMGYFGSLSGPPLLGFVADLTSLPLALGITALLTGAVAAVSLRRA